MAAQDTESKERRVVFQSQGTEVRAALIRLTRHAASIEVSGADIVLRASQALEDFKILLDEQPVYSGPAIVQGTVSTGSSNIYSLGLDDLAFDTGFFTAFGQTGQMRRRFDEFVGDWQKVCKVLPEFKVAIADIQTFLIDLRRWMEQVELGIRSSPRLDCAQQERVIIDELSPQVVPVLNTLFERFETIAAELNEEQRAVHRSYVQRLLHPIVLCAPFAYRAYRKPLGYAGDYEMVNMMLRDPREGGSLFAKVFNVWLLRQGSAAAHRNRIELLKKRLLSETATAARQGRKARILNLGCGPAREVQEFLAESELSNSAHFTLMDFDEETLQYTARVLRQKQQEHQRSTVIELVRKSVQQLLKDMVRVDGLWRGTRFDLIYCAGLFDYLPDRTCKKLVNLFYQSLVPGGLMMATNVTPATPNRGSLELILDWNLIYRDAVQMAALGPDTVPADELRIESDDTFVNVLIEARKGHGAG